MAVGTFIKRLFATDSQSAENLVRAQFLAAVVQRDAAARKDAQRLVDWYERDDAEVRLHVRTRANKTFDDTSDWQLPIANGVPRIIRRVSMNYSPPPLREYFDVATGKALKPTDKRLEIFKAMYKGLDRDRKMRSFDRFSTLLNTIHVEVAMLEGRIEWFQRLRPSVSVIPDPFNFLDFEKIAIEWTVMDPSTLEPLRGWIYWSDEEHIFVGIKGTRIGMTEEGGANPYKGFDGKPLIPITTIRKNEDISDYWGALGSDVVDAFETANVQLGNLWETTAIGNAAWPLLVNVNIPDGSTIKFGLKHPLIAKKVLKDEVPPSVTYPKPEPNYTETREIIDWFIAIQEANHGINPRAASKEQSTPESGFAKFMENIELLENREENASQWEAIEQDLDMRSRVVWNQNGGKPIAPSTDEVGLRLKFPKVQIPETPTERATRWALQIKSGQKSPVDYFMEEEGLDEEEALARAKKVKEQTSELGAMGTTGPGEFPEDKDPRGAPTKKPEPTEEP